MCAHGGRSSLFYGKQRDRSGVDPFAVCVGPTRRRCRRAGACRGPPLGQRAARRCSSQRRACAGSGPHADSGPLREEPRENKRESVSPPWWIQRPMRGPHADSGPCGQRMGRCIHHGGLTDSLLFSLGSSLSLGLILYSALSLCLSPPLSRSLPLSSSSLFYFYVSINKTTF